MTLPLIMRLRKLPQDFYIIWGSSVLALLVTLFPPTVFPFTLVRLLIIFAFIFFTLGFAVLKLLSLDVFLTVNELVLVSIGVSLSIVRVFSFAYKVWLDELSVMLSMVLLVLAMAGMLLTRKGSEVRGRLKKNSIVSLSLMGFAGLVGLIFPLLHVLESPLFFSADPWWLWNQMTSISAGENLSSPFSSLVLTGSLLDISPFQFVRFGGPLMSALMSMGIFTLARRGGLSRFSAIMASFFLATTPQIAYRFNMTLMENLALCLFVMVFLLIEITESQGLSYKNIVIPLSLILGSLMTYHLSSLFIIILLGFLFSVKVILRKWWDCIWLTISAFIAMISIGPFLQDILSKKYELFFLYMGQPGATATPVKYPPAYLDHILTKLSPFHFLLFFLGVSLMILSWKRYRNMLFWLTPYLSFFVFMTQVSGFGLFWPGWRFVIYLPLGTSLLASVPLHFVQDILRKSYSGTIAQRLRCFLRVSEKHWKDILPLVVLLPTIIPVVYLNSVLAYEERGWAGWDERDIQAIEWFKPYQQLHPGVIMCSHWFLVFSAKKYNIFYEQNTTVVQKILNTSSPSERVSMLKDVYGDRYPYVYFYVTSWEKRIYKEEYEGFYEHLSAMPSVIENEKSAIFCLYIGNYSRLSEDWAENNFEEYSGLVLSDSTEYVREGNHSVHIERSSRGSQWVKYNFYETKGIEVNSIEWNVLHFYLYNNGSGRNIFVRLYDSNDSPSGRAIIDIEHGWNDYYVYLSEFEMEEIDATSIRKIEWCFSWFDNSPLDVWLDGLYFCKES